MALNIDSASENSRGVFVSCSMNIAINEHSHIQNKLDDGHHFLNSLNIFLVHNLLY